MSRCNTSNASSGSLKRGWKNELLPLNPRGNHVSECEKEIGDRNLKHWAIGMVYRLNPNTFAFM